jgi:hypothetical protein
VFVRQLCIGLNARDVVSSFLRAVTWTSALSWTQEVLDHFLSPRLELLGLLSCVCRDGLQIMLQELLIGLFVPRSGLRVVGNLTDCLHPCMHCVCLVVVVSYLPYNESSNQNRTRNECM